MKVAVGRCPQSGAPLASQSVASRTRRAGSRAARLAVALIDPFGTTVTPGKLEIHPKGTEVRTVVKHAAKRLRKHWPDTRLVWRGDNHYGRIETIDWAD
jgi:hypothetical protein